MTGDGSHGAGKVTRGNGPRQVATERAPAASGGSGAEPGAGEHEQQPVAGTAAITRMAGEPTLIDAPSA